jgi:hypothetical protein
MLFIPDKAPKVPNPITYTIRYMADSAYDRDYGWQVYLKVYSCMSIYQYIPVYTLPFLRLDLSPIGLLSFANHDFWREKIVPLVSTGLECRRCIVCTQPQRYLLRICLQDYILASVQA